MHPPWSASFFPDSEEMRAAGSGSLPWELEERHIVWMVTVFQFVYWVVTIVILMNLLIAMMASTYQKVSDNAEADDTYFHRAWLGEARLSVDSFSDCYDGQLAY